MSESSDGAPTNNEPDFLFGGKRLISEANWSEYEAQGVSNVVSAIPDNDAQALHDEMERKRSAYGTENILLGDAYDIETRRPLHHKPGIGIYTTAEGMERYRSTHPTALKLPDGSHVVARPGQRIRWPQPDMPPSADTKAGES